MTVQKMTGYGTCPVCNGTKRAPADFPRDGQEVKWYSHVYDAVTHTMPCRNCGAQMMFGKATGEVKLRPDGTPCTHEYDYHLAGRCYHIYTCRHCGWWYDIDSGD